MGFAETTLAKAVPATMKSGTRVSMSHPKLVYASLPIECLYEKVVKVKADVAAILKFFLLIPQIEADHHDAAPLVPIGGMRKGGFSAAV